VGIMTKSIEDYLKIIFELGGHTNYVSNKKLSDTLKVAPPSANEMIKKLVEKDYLLYKPYKGTKLKKKGLNIAIEMLRKHRIWEVFLNEVLELKWDELHVEAEKLEHVTSDILEEKLFNYLERPKYCPHGNIIPNMDNYIDKDNFISLVNLKKNSIFKLYNVVDEPELLKYLSSLGIDMKNTYILDEHQPYDGPLIIRNKIGNKKIILSKNAARKINVKKIAINGGNEK
jgi:DtxR family Mn-dependent transcriptional regulator